jgi:hypothetical protein
MLGSTGSTLASQQACMMHGCCASAPAACMRAHARQGSTRRSTRVHPVTAPGRTEPGRVDATASVQVQQAKLATRCAWERRAWIPSDPDLQLARESFCPWLPAHKRGLLVWRLPLVVTCLQGCNLRAYAPCMHSRPPEAGHGRPHSSPIPLES